MQELQQEAAAGTFDVLPVYMFDRLGRRDDETPLHLSGSSLLVGSIFCGHCKNRLTLTASGKKNVRKDRTVRDQVKSRYQYHFKARRPDLCDGQSGYGVTKPESWADLYDCTLAVRGPRTE